KSTVLEALDSFYNDKPWNLNVSTKKSGISVTQPLIVPVFLIKKDKISAENYNSAQAISDVIWLLEESDIATINRPHLKSFIDQRERLNRQIFKDEYFLIPLGNDISGNITISFFNCSKLLISYSLVRNQRKLR